MYDVTCRWHLRKPNLLKQRAEWWLPGAVGGENGETLVRKFKLVAGRGVSCGP